jgi:O-antigen/teichoic acid export membrane protein
LTTLVTFGLASSALLATIACAFLLAVPGAHPPSVTDSAVIALGVAVVGTTLSESFYGFLLGVKRFRSILLLGVGAWSYAILVAIASLLDHLDVTTAAWAFGSAQLLGGVTMMTAAVRGHGFGRTRRRLYVETIRFGSRASLGSVASFLNFRADQLVLAYLATEATLGLYAIAVNVSELLLYLPNAASTALVAAIASVSDEVQVSSTLRSFRVLMLITAALVVPAALVGPFFIPLAFGSAYDGSIAPYLWLIFGTFGWGAISLFSKALVAGSRPGRSSIGLATALVVGLLLDLALIPPFGATGAAAAATGAFFVGGAATVLTFRRHAPFSVSELVPRQADLAVLGSIVRRLPLRLPRPSPS